MQKNKLFLYKLSIILFIIIIAVFVACSKDGGKNSLPIVTNYNINELNYNELPYTWESPMSLDIDYPIDDNGTIIFIYNGNNYYHPVQITPKILRFLDGY